MGALSRVYALVKKESIQIFRDPSSLLISFFLPLLLLFIYGYGVSLDLKHLRVGLVLEDTASDAQSFAASLVGSPYFDVQVARDKRELYDDLERGALRGFIVVPSYFSSFRENPGLTAPIQVITDGSEPNTANFLRAFVEGAFANWLQEEAIRSELIGELPQIVTMPRYWYNEEVESRYFLLSGSLAIIMTLIGTLLTALVVAREWERGTMEALISTTVSKFEILAGKMIPYFTLGMGSMALCVFVSTVLFGLPLRGSWLLLSFVSAVFLFCALGIGLLISTLSKEQTISSQIAVVVGFLPAYILSGFLFEISSMPAWIQGLTYLLPARYFVQSLQTLFLVGDVWSLIWWDVIPMCLIGLFFFSLSLYKMVKRLDG